MSKKVKICCAIMRVKEVRGMLKMVGKFLGLGLLGLAIAFTTVAIVKGTTKYYSIELAAKKDDSIEVDEDGVGVVLLKFEEKGNN